MSFDTLMATSQKLNAAVETLAAIGAELRIRQEGLATDSSVRERIGAVVQAVDPALFDDVAPPQAEMARAFIVAFFRQALDLLENPARPPGWAYDDAAVIEPIGKGSRVVVRCIEALAARRPSLAATLKAPGAFLDIGVGAAWLAIEAAKTWPSMAVTGIDPWEPALALARKNVAASGMADRIAIRKQGAEALDERDVYTLAWFAGPFIPKPIAEEAVVRVFGALKPGGTFVFGLFSADPTPLGQALADLRVVRSGGHPWRTADIEARLGDAGFAEIETFATKTPALLVAGRKPG